MDLVLKLLLDLYHGARERPLDEFQDFALGLVKPAFEFESARWGSASIDNRGFRPFAVHLHNDPEESVADWAEFISIDTFATEAAGNLGRATVAHFPTRYSGRGCAGIREYASKYGHENALALSVGDITNCGGLLNWIALYRADPDHHFTSREQRLGEALLPHLLQALVINRSIGMESLRTSKAPARRQTFAMADRGGVLWFAEPDFARLVRSEFPAWVEPTLPRAVTAALLDRGKFTGTDLSLGAAPCGKLLLLKARARDRFDRLTPREREVVLAYGQGLPVKAVASRLGISPATVHHHLRIAYDKLGIDNKAALARLVVGADS